MKVRMFVWAAFVLSLPTFSKAADAYKVDSVHSGTFFRVKHLNVGFAYGRFNDITGNVTIDEQNPSASTFDLQVKAETVDTGNEKRDQHLRGPDFLSTKEFPTISFKSTAVKLKDKTYEVTGDLTLHGVTKSITVELKRVGSGNDPFGGYRTGFETNFSVRRADFGMNFMPDAIGSDIWMLVSFEAVKQK